MYLIKLSKGCRRLSKPASRARELHFLPPTPCYRHYGKFSGLYFAFVYAKQHIVVHEWETNKALHQVGLDDGLVDVSLVPCGEPEDMNADF